jgi:hypothetical protein
MDWLPSGVTGAQVGVGFIVNLASSIFLFLLGLFIGRRRGHRKVAIHARRVDKMGRKKPSPKIILATFSGYSRRAAPKTLSDDAFFQALRQADLATLPIDETTDGIGQVIQLLRTYAGSLDELILLTTKSEKGASSMDSLPLLRKWANDNMPRPLRITDECVDLDQDDNVTNDSYEAARDILERLETEDDRKPKEILVDVSGSVRSMQTGVLLACLRPDQDAHLIGVEYNPDGTRGNSFPMLIHFEPDLGRK